MLLVIFGAGASYDSAPDFPAPAKYDERPPLANELFERRKEFRDILDEFRQCQLLVPYLIGDEVNLEAELEIINSREPKSKLDREQLIGIRFYLWEIIRRVDANWGVQTQKYYQLSNTSLSARTLAQAEQRANLHRDVQLRHDDK